MIIYHYNFEDVFEVNDFVVGPRLKFGSRVLGYVSSITEKPVHKFFVNAGIYVLEPRLTNYIDSDLYLDMPNFFEAQIDKGEKISVFPIHEYWLDIGRIEEYERANKEVINIL